MTARPVLTPEIPAFDGQAFASSNGCIPNALQPSQSRDCETLSSDGGDSSQALRVMTGDCRTLLGELATGSVQCCVTSPPYFNQRDYGVEGQMGLEDEPNDYVERMVEVFSAIKRVLRDDGTLWLNLGDSYAASGRGGGGSFCKANKAWAAEKIQKTGFRMPKVGYKQKDLLLIPSLVAMALRADGWYLRKKIVWAKPNCMPESVTDRPTSSHEEVFLMAKSERYFYDAEAVRLPPLPSSIARLEQHVEAQLGSVRANGGAKTNGTMKAVMRGSNKQRGHSRRHDGFNDRWDKMEKEEQQQNGSNLRDVWWIAPAQTQDSHFAVMPATLAAVCILAGSKPGDTILDPFGGSGTTGMVAIELARKAILIELNPEYAKLIERRTTTTMGLAL